MSLLDELELTGRSCTHVVQLEDPPCALHREAVEPFLSLRAAAAGAGIDLVPVSSFRDFARQTAIWNMKYRGERTLFDRAGIPLDRGGLAGDALVDAILIWSALPGASRHHWGTDFDVIDRAAVPPGYSPQLLPHEFAPGALFEPLDAWLRANMARFGFYRPYRTDRGGVQPEPWHLSYAPVAQAALAALTPEVLRAALDTGEIEGRELVLARLEELHARYVLAVDPPPGR